MKKLILATATAAVVLSGCAGMTDTQRNTGAGAGIGAGTGAIIDGSKKKK